MLDRMSIHLRLAIRIVIITLCLVISITLVLVSLIVYTFVPLHSSFCNVYMLGLICDVCHVGLVKFMRVLKRLRSNYLIRHLLVVRFCN